MKSESDEGQADLDDVDDGSHTASSDSEDDLDEDQDITPSCTNGTFSHGIAFPSLHDNPTEFERVWYNVVKKDWGDYMMFLDEPEAKLLGAYVKDHIKQEKQNQQRLGKQVRAGNWVAWLLVRNMWPRNQMKASKMYRIFRKHWDEDQEDKLFWIPYPTEWPVALPEQARIRLQTIKQLQEWQSKLQDSEIRDELQQKRIDGNWYEKRLATDIIERLESDDRDEKIQDYIESLASQGFPKPKQTKKRAAAPDVQDSLERKRRSRSPTMTPRTTPRQLSLGYPQLDGANHVGTLASGSPSMPTAVPTRNMSEQLEALEENMETLKREARGLQASIEEQTELFQQMQATCKATLEVTKTLRTYTTVVLSEMGYELE